MKFQSQVFLLFGFLSLVGIFIAKKLIISYNLGGEGVNLLPINFFEFLLLLLSFLIFLFSILITFILSKKHRVKITGKKKTYFFLFLMIGYVIVLLLINSNKSNLVAPISIIYFGLFLLNWNSFKKSRLFILGISEIIIGVIAFIFSFNNLLFLTIGFGVLPIIYGISLFKKLN